MCLDTHNQHIYLYRRALESTTTDFLRALYLLFAYSCDFTIAISFRQRRRLLFLRALTFLLDTALQPWTGQT